MHWAVPLIVLLSSAQTESEHTARSLRVKREVEVLSSPRGNSHRIGKVVAGTRLAWKRVLVRSTKKCAKWYEVEPRGWVCGDDVALSTDEPAGVEVPKIKEGKVLPGAKLRLVARKPS